jgi:hypothetical protein
MNINLVFKEIARKIVLASINTAQQSVHLMLGTARRACANLKQFPASFHFLGWTASPSQPQPRSLIPLFRSLNTELRSLVSLLRSLNTEFRSLVSLLRSLNTEFRSLVPLLRSLVPPLRSLNTELRNLVPLVGIEFSRSVI